MWMGCFLSVSLSFFLLFFSFSTAQSLIFVGCTEQIGLRNPFRMHMSNHMWFLSYISFFLRFCLVGLEPNVWLAYCLGAGAYVCVWCFCSQYCMQRFSTQPSSRYIKEETAARTPTQTQSHSLAWKMPMCRQTTVTHDSSSLCCYIN